MTHGVAVVCEIFSSFYLLDSWVYVCVGRVGCRLDGLQLSERIVSISEMSQTKDLLISEEARYMG